MQLSDEVERWAVGVLLEAHTIEPCRECGFKKLRFDHSALQYAHGLARRKRPRSLSAARCIEVVDTVLDGLGDQCPVCD